MPDKTLAPNRAVPPTMSKDLAWFLRRWRDRSPLNGGLPYLNEMSLDDIGPLTPTLSIVEQVDHPKDGPYLRCVFAGEDHELMLGYDPAGLAMHHIFKGKVGDQIVESLEWALRRGEPHYWRRDKGFAIEAGRSYERLAVPVRDPDGGPDMIVAVFAWHDDEDDKIGAPPPRPRETQPRDAAVPEPTFAVTVSAESLPFGGECVLSNSDLGLVERFSAALESVLAPFRTQICQPDATRTHLITFDVSSLGLRVSASVDGTYVTSPEKFDWALRPSLEVLRNALLEYTSSPRRAGHPYLDLNASNERGPRLLGQRLFETGRIVRFQFAGAVNRMFGLTVGESTLLNTVFLEGSVSITYLCARLKLAEDAVRVEIRRLADWELVDWKEDDIADRSFVSLTEEGKRIAKQVHAMAARRQKWFEDHISKEDLRVFYRTLDKLNELCHEHLEDLPFLGEPDEQTQTAPPIRPYETFD